MTRRLAPAHIVAAILLAVMLLFIAGVPLLLSDAGEIHGQRPAGLSDLLQALTERLGAGLPNVGNAALGQYRSPIFADYRHEFLPLR